MIPLLDMNVRSNASASCSSPPVSLPEESLMLSHVKAEYLFFEVNIDAVRSIEDETTNFLG